MSFRGVRVPTPTVGDATEVITVDAGGSYVLQAPAAGVVVGTAFGFPTNGFVAARYYGTPFVQVGTPNSFGNGLLFATPIWVPRDVNIDRLAFHVTAVAAGSNVRMGIYRDDGTGFPGAIVAGSDVSVATAVGVGLKEGVIAVALTKGLYWLASVSQGGSPTLTVIKGIAGIVAGTGPGGATVVETQAVGYRDNIGSHLGALPTPFPVANIAGMGDPGIARVMMRVV